MKKLLFLLSIILLVSCNNTYNDSKVENSDEITTVEIQQSVIDSCATIAVVDDDVYLLKDNKVVNKYKVVKDDQTIVDDGIIVIFLLIYMVFIVLIAIKITE